MDAVLVGVFYIQQRTDIITARLQGSWRHSYEGDRQLIESVQEKYDCCGFRDITDMVFPPTQGPGSCAEEEKQKIVAKYTETAKQLHGVCGNMDSQTLGLCARTNNPLSATVCEIPGIKQYLADCTKMHKQNHTAYVNKERYLANCAARCTWQKGCSEPWSRSLQWFMAWLMLAIGVGFLIKVGRIPMFETCGARTG